VFSVLKLTRTQSEVLKKLAKISAFMTKELRDRLTQNLKTYCTLDLPLQTSSTRS
jgi:hypothetical protein